MRILLSLILLAVASALILACGGGSSTPKVQRPATTMGPPPSPPPSPPPKPACIETFQEGCLSTERYNERKEASADTFRSSELFEEQWGLSAVKADYGMAHLWLMRGVQFDEPENYPGAGVTVGVMDTGIDLSHPSFEGVEVSETILLGSDEDGSEYSHGTSVASIIVSRSEFSGVAPGAEIKMFAISLGSGDPDRFYEPADLSQDLAADDSFEADKFGKILNDGMDILNLSFGLQSLIEHHNEQEIRNAFPRIIEVWAQADAEGKTIFVWAAGNANDHICHPGSDNCVGSDRTNSRGVPAGSLNASSPGLQAGATAFIEELRGHTIAVAATNEEGDITSFSNRCGIAADWCLAAPGEDIRVAYFGPDLNTGLWGSRDYESWPGTSFAAPMVSGGLALMKQFFRDQLPNTELVTRLFATADKSEQYSERLIYGQGLMDLDAALSPVGNPSVSSGNSVVVRGIPIAATRLRSSGALGDGLARSVAGQQIAGFDDLGAPFWFDLGSFPSAAPGPTPSSRLRDLMPPQPIRVPLQMNRNQMAYTRADTGRSTWELGLFERLRGAHKGHFSLVEDAMTVRFMGHRGLEATAYATAADRAGRPQASGITLSLPLSNAPLRLRGGWIAERESLLGTVAEGAPSVISPLSASLHSHSTYQNTKPDPFGISRTKCGTTDTSVTNKPDTSVTLQVFLLELDLSRDFRFGGPM